MSDHGHMRGLSAKEFADPSNSAFAEVFESHVLNEATEVVLAHLTVSAPREGGDWMESSIVVAVPDAGLGHHVKLPRELQGIRYLKENERRLHLSYETKDCTWLVEEARRIAQSIADECSRNPQVDRRCDKIRVRETVLLPPLPDNLWSEWYTCAHVDVVCGVGSRTLRQAMKGVPSKRSDLAALYASSRVMRTRAQRGPSARRGPRAQSTA